jgi:TfoX/Sxy family transcriptional regulator of competence genes
MVTPVYSEKHREVLDSMLLEIPGVKAGKAFGYPGYYVGGKLFACVYEDGVSLKVPEEVRERLLKEKGVDYFVPMGRVKMKEWVLITKKRSSDYLKYEDDFIEAIQYVLALSTKPPAKK